VTEAVVIGCCTCGSFRMCEVQVANGHDLQEYRVHEGALLCGLRFSQQLVLRVCPLVPRFDRERLKAASLFGEADLSALGPHKDLGCRGWHP
jgi:hypothetical protein